MTSHTEAKLKATKAEWSTPQMVNLESSLGDVQLGASAGSDSITQS